jgi:hypothetical protein
MSEMQKRVEPSGELNLVVQDLREYADEDCDIEPVGVQSVLSLDESVPTLVAAGLKDDEILAAYQGRLRATDIRSNSESEAAASIAAPDDDRKGVPHVGQYLLLLLPKKFRENLVGDLEEEYRTIVLPQYGPPKAKLWYWSQVLSAIVRAAWPAVLRFVGVEAFLRMIR